ncbi:MAG TPA: class I SAM-dependent methyltransferase, partial [Vicinamibacterales bacterium]|nr:class I SAM-dependent methyltransferase [Vicinamibacterales bacterium]
GSDRPATDPAGAGITPAGASRAGAIVPTRAGGPAAGAGDRREALPDALYLAFEDCFRGREEEIRARLADYVGLFEGTRDVADIGCGRGEFLELLRERGIGARGVDANPAMVAACRARGLSAEVGDALAWLEARPEASLGGLFAAQVVEHFEPAYLVRFLREAARALAPGARIVLETVNPVSWVAFSGSFLRDPTHAAALHPVTLKFLLVAAGFEEVEIRFRSPLAERDRLRRLPALPAPPPGAPAEVRRLAELVEAFNLNMERLNDVLFAPLDYAAIGRKTAGGGPAA